jgi:hypothetical protein
VDKSFLLLLTSIVLSPATTLKAADQTCRGDQIARCNNADTSRRRVFETFTQPRGHVASYGAFTTNCDWLVHAFVACVRCTRV